MARKLGKVDDYEYFSKRALAYQKYWDKDTRFFRGKIKMVLGLLRLILFIQLIGTMLIAKEMVGNIHG